MVRQLAAPRPSPCLAYSSLASGLLLARARSASWPSWKPSPSARRQQIVWMTSPAAATQISFLLPVQFTMRWLPGNLTRRLLMHEPGRSRIGRGGECTDRVARGRKHKWPAFPAEMRQHACSQKAHLWQSTVELVAVSISDSRWRDISNSYVCQGHATRRRKAMVDGRSRRHAHAHTNRQTKHTETYSDIHRSYRFSTK